ncbi:MAG: NADH-quinone oxidoreductase subunit C, partial [Proteobacteria bacterium]|nr:NADH-quinone oxidoreductase subunit C [Pseudomonadota bacterium]
MDFIKDSIDCPTFLLKNKEDLIPFMEFLKGNDLLSFDLIADVTAIDNPNKTDRFTLVYHIFSIKNKVRIRVKLPVKDGESVKSVTSIWKGAEWLEREVYD